MGFGERLSNAATRVGATLDKAIETKGLEERDRQNRQFEQERDRVRALVEERLVGVRHTNDLSLEGQRATNAQTLQKDAQDFKQNVEIPADMASEEARGKTQRDVANIYRSGYPGSTGASTKDRKAAIDAATAAYDDVLKDYDPSLGADPELEQRAIQAALQRGYSYSRGDPEALRAIAYAIGLDPRTAEARIAAMTGERGSPDPGGEIQPPDAEVMPAPAQQPPLQEAMPEAATPAVPPRAPVPAAKPKTAAEQKAEAMSRQAKGTADTVGAPAEAAVSAVASGVQSLSQSAGANPKTIAARDTGRAAERRAIKIKETEALKEKYIAGTLEAMNRNRKRQGQKPLDKLPAVELAKINKMYAETIAEL
jgi:hypothetical protein